MATSLCPYHLPLLMTTMSQYALYLLLMLFITIYEQFRRRITYVTVIKDEGSSVPCLASKPMLEESVLLNCYCIVII